MKVFIPTDANMASELTKKVYQTIDSRGCYKGNDFYSSSDPDLVEACFRCAINNNLGVQGDHTKIVPDETYMVLFCDDNDVPRGLSLFFCAEGAWFTKSTSRSLVEQLQIRLDDTRYSAGVSRHMAEYLKSLVDKGVADRAVAGGSSNDALLVKNAFEKVGYKTTYEFTYEGSN